MKIRIKKLGGQNQTPFKNSTDFSQSISDKSISTNKTLQPVDRDQANVEVEKGEFIVANYMQDGIPETYKAGGQRHSNGGTPLNLPDKSFVFSDTRSMMIKDKELLKEFNVSKSSTPAQIAKKYDISKYKEILLNPDADKREVETAEKMIQNYNEKLGKLALVQESMKGFEEGIPQIAFPYLMTIGVSPEMILPEPTPSMEEEQELPEAQRGRNIGRRLQGAVQGFRNPYNYQSMRGSTPPFIVPYGAPGYANLPYNIYQSNFDYSNQNIGNQPSSSQSSQPTVKTVKKQDIPKNAVIKEEGATDLKAGEYIKRKDGTYVKFVGQSSMKMDNKDFISGKAFETLKSDLDSLSPDSKKLFADKIRQNVKESKTRNIQKEEGKKLQQEIDNMSDEDLINKWTTYQSKVYSSDWKQKEKGQKLESDRGAGSFDPDAAIFQAGFLGIADLQKEGIDDFQKFDIKTAPNKFDPIRANELSAEDKKNIKSETDTDLKRGDIVKKADGEYYRYNEGMSPVDGYFNIKEQLPGNTTLQQFITTPKLVDEFQDVPEVEEKIGPVDPGKLTPEPELNIAPEFWKQDKIRMLNDFLNYANTKKYIPEKTDLDLPKIDPTFLNDSRAIAANAELNNIVTQGLGPQSMAERMALQARGAAQAANIKADYDARNVGIANQFAAQNAQIEGQEAMINNQKAEELFDQWTIANQMYDNEKAAARTAMAQSYSDAITNKWQTDAFNKMFPQYAVLPGVGGRTIFTQGKQINPTNQPDPQDQMTATIKYLRDQGFSNDQIMNYLNKSKA